MLPKGQSNLPEAWHCHDPHFPRFLLCCHRHRFAIFLALALLSLSDPALPFSQVLDVLIFKNRKLHLGFWLVRPLLFLQFCRPKDFMAGILFSPLHLLSPLLLLASPFLLQLLQQEATSPFPLWSLFLSLLILLHKRIN
jgi:hypothetical protein